MRSKRLVVLRELVYRLARSNPLIDTYPCIRLTEAQSIIILFHRAFPVKQHGLLENHYNPKR